MPDLTADADLDAVLAAMRACNEYTPPDRPAAPRHPLNGTPAAGDRPGDDFNRRAEWSEILGPHGWRVCRTSGPVTYWTRPGKEPRDGLSATTGFCSPGEGRPDLLYVFSTNAHPFEAGTSYSRFAAHALLNHRADFAAAAADLRRRGFGGELPAPPPLPPPPDEPTDDVARIADLRRAGATVRWVWPGWIQRGVCTAIAAQGGTGKTRLTADLVRRVCRGLPWPDGTPTAGWDGKVVALWVVSDNHHDEMVTLCESFGIDAAVAVNADRADPYMGVTLEQVEDFAALERRIKAVRPLVVVVDTVGNATDLNLSKQEDAKAFYQPLQLIARRQDVGMLCLTHLNAGGKVLGRRALEKVRTCIRMHARVVNETSCRRRLEVIKSNAPYPSPLGVEMGDAGNEYDAEDVPPGPEDEAAAEQGPPPAVRECADWLRKRLGGGPAQVYTVRNEAEGDGISSKTLYAAKPLAGVLEYEEADGFGKRRKWWKLKEK